MINLLECPACTSSELAILGELLIRQNIPPQNIQQAGTNALLSCALQTSTALVKTLCCQTCSHVFLSPTFTDDELNRLYSEQCVKETKLQYRTSEKESGKSWAEQNKLPREDYRLRLSRNNSYRSRRLWDIIHAVNPSISISRILDYGAQTGELTQSFVNAKRFAYDKSIGFLKDENIEALSTHADIVQLAPYDLIVLSHVLEHVPGPLELLRFLREQLSDNGILYIEVPLEYCRSALKKEAIILGPHINFFSRKSLYACIERNAFFGIAYMHREIAPYGELQMPVIKVLAAKHHTEAKYRRPNFTLDILVDSLLLLLSRKVRFRFGN
jgi:SAM-dependent methyltransferase